MRLERPLLFEGVKEWTLFLLFASIIFSLMVTLHYRTYSKIKEFDTYDTTALILKQIDKIDYTILHLQSEDGFDFYTAASKDIRDIKGYRLKVTMRTDKISFLDYLGGFYASSIINAVEPKRDNRYVFSNHVKNQHENSDIGELYSALFLATGVTAKLRETLSIWGVNHLVAISGFHLGVLSALLWFMLARPYQTIQQKFFPYRDRRGDILGAIAIILFLYLLFLGSPPSLLRAYAMLLVGYILYISNMKLLSFSTLSTAIILLIALFPPLFFKLGFWFSVAGVFYIFLFLKEFSYLKKVPLVLGLNFWVFIMMLPIVHYWYPLFTYAQLLSPLLTMLFVIFYPAALLLHLLEYGWLFDGVIESMLSYKTEGIDISVEAEYIAIFIAISLLGVKFRVALVVAFLLALYIFGRGLHHLAEL